MTVYVRNLVINTDEDFSENFELFGSTGGSTAGFAAVDLTGFAGTCHMRKTPESSSHTGFGVSFTDRVNGKIRISMASTVTSTLKPGRYVYDLLLLDDAYKKSVAVEGTVLVRSGISTGCF
jgi:hypothetical protein